MCGTCKADWTAGSFSAGCDECGGGALDGACPVCLGLCGERWHRAVADSNDGGMAVWVGQCGLPGSPVMLEWWLDDAALPDRIWACLIPAADGRASVLDADGRVHCFDSMALARTWLGEDEYVPHAELRAAGRLGWDSRPAGEWRARLQAVLVM